MEPEISHRCKTCGAAIRANRKFCHQCGAAFAESPSSEVVKPDLAKTGTLKKTERSLMPLPQVTSAEVRDLPFPGTQTEVNQVPSTQTGSGRVVVRELVERSEGSHSRRQRVKDVARDVVADNVLPRVEKLRHASSVVLEEAAIDPSLRFVLIALFLFVVFLVLLVLSFIK